MGPVLADPDLACPCGSGSRETLDEGIVCSDCGRIIESESLVNYTFAPSSGMHASDNIVPEGCTGAHLTGARCSINYAKRDKVKRLQAQASNYGRDLELSGAAIAKALALIEDHTRLRPVADPDTSAVAAALVIGARMEGFPVTMKDVCLRLRIPFSDFKRSLAALQRHVPAPIPTLQVRTIAILPTAWLFLLPVLSFCSTLCAQALVYLVFMVLGTHEFQVTARFCRQRLLSFVDDLDMYDRMFKIADVVPVANMLQRPCFSHVSLPHRA
jgi:hypothetical protein